jgi:hypothetical protein
MAYNAKNAKAAYYKQPVTSFAQLQENCIRICLDSRQGSSTKAANIEKMFNSYLDSVDDSMRKQYAQHLK